jgi:hypothetical protein
MVRQLQKDLPELLSFFYFPQHLWRKLRNQHYRALLRGSPTPNPAHGLLWTGLAIPSFQRSTSTGKVAPSSFLHKRLDIT